MSQRDGQVRFVHEESEDDGRGVDDPSMPLQRLNSQAQMQAIHAELEELKQSEDSLLFQIELVEKSKKPLIDELALLRGSIHDKEVQLWKLEHEEDGPHPANSRFAWVQSFWFSSICSLVILANLIIMFMQMKNDELLGKWTKTVDRGFLAFYVLELTLKALCFEKTLLIGPCHVVWWNWLDVIIVLSGLVEMLLPLLASGNTPLPVHLNGLRGLRILRLLRLARVARGLKLLRFVVQSDLSWTEHHAFESSMMTVIVLNAIVMWLELDYPMSLWRVVEEVFLVVYVFELCVRVGHHGLEYFVHENWTWHYLDFVIVVLGVAEQWMLPLWHYFYSMIMGSQSQATISMSLVRSLRIVRVFRVLRLARLLRSVKQLYKLIHGVVESMASVGWVIILTFILLYSAALVFTTLVGRGYIYSDTEVPPEAMDNFGTVWRSFLALFKLMNDDQSVVTQIIDTVGGQILFYAFMMLSNWMMLAILTSVISDNMMSVSRAKEEEDRRSHSSERATQAKRRITQIFQTIDSDNDGTINEDELVQLLTNPQYKAELCEAAGLDPTDLVEMLHCASYKSKTEKRVILYKQFLTMLQDESASAKERSIFKVLESMRAMEFRLEERMNAALRVLKMPEQDLLQLPSLHQELLEAQMHDEKPAQRIINNINDAAQKARSKSSLEMELDA